MRQFVRYLLWILIAVLPLQGGAAAFMSCAAEKAQVGISAHNVENPPGGAHIQMSHGHCDDSLIKKSTSSHGKCSHCASCCTGATVPLAVPLGIPPSTFSTFAAVSVEPAMTAHIPATLDRPPRRNA